jgi:hypothetical protein
MVVILTRFSGAASFASLQNNLHPCSPAMLDRSLLDFAFEAWNV